MDEKQIKNLLKEYDSRTELNEKRVKELYERMRKADGVINNIGQISRSIIDISQGTVQRDVSDLMIKHEELEKQKSLDIRRELANLADEKEMLNRVWVCLQSLQGMEYQVIHALYISNRPYKKVLADFGKSEKTFLKNINEGLKKMVDLYNSDYTDKEIGEGSYK